VAGIAALAVFAVAFPMDLRRAASGVFRSGVARITPNTLVALHVDGKTATVDVLDEGGMRVIRTNGKTDAALEMDPRSGPTLDELTMAMLALMPLGHNPDARTAAVIGLGSGMSTHVLLGSPRLERVDSIEIEPAMVEGARLFRPKVEAAFSDPRSRIVIDDAKSYFARAGHRYDIIVSEPSNPWVSGVASLFTEEFYRRLAHSLNDGGVLSQWIHSYEMDAVGLASIINAVAKTFPDFIVYTSVDSDIILVARKRGPIGAFDDQVLRWPAMREVVDRLVLEDPGVLARRSVGSSSAVLALYGPLRVPANSDYFPLLEQRASKTRFTKQRVTDLTDLQAAPLPLLEMLDGTFRPSAHRVKSRAWGLSDRAASDAWGYHDLLLDPSFVPAGPAPASDSREHAARVVSLWAANCPGNLPFSRMLPSLATMAEVVNPNLAAETALEVWRHLGRSRCAKALAPGERRWLELFTAVAARDAAVMAEAGTAVLESARGTRGALNEYAFIAATTGLICQDRLADANRLFEHATRDWLPAGGNATAIRYLYAMANLPPGTTRPATAACGGKLASRDPGPTSAATRSDSARGRSTGR
jgi:spermidine synthase